MILMSLHWLPLAEGVASRFGLDLSLAALQGQHSELPALATCTYSRAHADLLLTCSRQVIVKHAK